jgi:exopolyphosphatase/guanosine-5'-triphosphate,3'-diphosphate pyrophosphatase
MEERNDGLEAERGEVLGEPAVSLERRRVELARLRLDPAPRHREAEGVGADGGGELRVGLVALPRADRRAAGAAARPPGGLPRRPVAGVVALDLVVRNRDAPETRPVGKREGRRLHMDLTTLRYNPSRMTDARVVATIDIGSNSIKLLVARLDPEDPDHYDEVLREKEMVRLAQETLATGVLSEEAMADGVDCVKRYAALARAAGASRITAVATCAVREANNGPDFVRRVRRETGVRPAVISGEEEARLTMRAVRLDLPASCDPLLVVDIGGGSTEIAVARGDEIALAESLDLGVVRLTERFVRSDPLSGKDERSLTRAIRSRLKKLRRPVRKTRFRTAVGTSGTVLALTQIARALRGRTRPGAGHLSVGRRDLERAVKVLTRTTLKEKARINGLEPERRDIITSGGILLRVIMEELGIESLLVSERSLRDSLVLESPAAPRGSEERDARRASVERLARRTGVTDGHAARVRDLAVRLFDKTHSLHQLTPLEREWLEHAAILHDVGLSISYQRHHHHSYYLIVHGGMKGFSRDEVEVIAQVARYHRKAPPSERHQPFRRLDPWKKPVVEKLAAILRLADGLDRTHRGHVSGVRLEVRRRKVVVTAEARGPADLEAWAAKEKSDLFEKVFGRRVVIRLRKSAGGSAKPRPAPVLALVS